MFWVAGSASVLTPISLTPAPPPPPTPPPHTLCLQREELRITTWQFKSRVGTFTFTKTACLSGGPSGESASQNKWRWEKAT